MKIFKDIYDRPLEPGQRILLSYLGHLKDCYYLYSTERSMVFSAYHLYHDIELRNLDLKTKREKAKEKVYNPLCHNHFIYYNHVYKGSYYIIDSDKNNLPAQLRKYLKDD